MIEQTRRQPLHTSGIQERRVNRALRERFGIVKRMLTPLLRQSEHRLPAVIYEAFYRILQRLRRVYPQLNPYPLEALIASV